MLVGNLPFEDTHIATLFAKIKTAKFQIPNFVPEMAQDFINKLLQPYPPARIKLEDIKTEPW